MRKFELKTDDLGRLCDNLSKIYLKYNLSSDNMIYSVDMIRLKTYITYFDFTQIEFRFNTVWKDYVKKSYLGKRVSEFKYNYVIEVGENKSFWFGFLHNNEDIRQQDNAEYNFTIEFNPNKIRDDRILEYLLNISGEWYLRSFDLAVDIPISILDLIFDISGRVEENIISRGYDNKTIYLGKGNSRVKIYNKKNESNIDILYNLTRIEISSQYDDYDIRKIKYFKFDNIFPNIYLNEYLYSFKDYEDKTLLAVLFAVQNGFPIKNLTRAYKRKIKDLFKGGYKLDFSVIIASDILKQTIYHYFINNSKFVFL